MGVSGTFDIFSVAIDVSAGIAVFCKAVVVEDVDEM